MHLLKCLPGQLAGQMLVDEVQQNLVDCCRLLFHHLRDRAPCDCAACTQSDIVSMYVQMAALQAHTATHLVAAKCYFASLAPPHSLCHHLAQPLHARARLSLPDWVQQLRTMGW